MAFVPIDDTCRLALEYNFWGQPGVNVFHFGENGTQTQPQMAAIAASFHTHYVATVLGGKTTAFVMSKITVTDLTTDSGPQAVLSVTDAGSSANPPSTTERAMIVNLFTDKRGRSYRGRVFDSGYEASFFNPDGGVIGTHQAAIAADWEAFRVAMATDLFSLRVASYYHDKVARNPAVANDVISVAVAREVGIQRRRRAYV